MDPATTALGGGNQEFPAAGGTAVDESKVSWQTGIDMQTINRQLTQTKFTSPAKRLFLQKGFAPVIIIIVGALSLLLLAGLGKRVAERRTERLRWQSHPTPAALWPSLTVTPTPTPTATPSTPLPTKVNEQGTVGQSCFEGYDCVIGIEQGTQTIYSRGICKNGVCIPRPTSVPKKKEVKE